MKDEPLHIEKENLKNEQESRFVAVDNAFLGAQGRRLLAHRLLFSVDLGGMDARLKAVAHEPYR